jgi:hypothetical protein
MISGEITIYQPNNQSTMIEVRVEDETIWLTQVQIVTLFASSKANVSEHIKHIFQTGELQKASTVRKIRTVQVEGNREVSRLLTYFNLDMIISIGYRVNSKQGTQFRIWANQILKEYLLKGYAINKRVDRLEEKLIEHDKKFDLILNTNLPANEGIFYNGQIFDAWLFVSDIVKKAEKSIILIDNYVDESVLLLLSKRNKNVKATIFTAKITKQLLLDLEKHNSQYPEISLKTYNKSHDRFLIIDNKTIYHIGASLKDLGKKWFAFSKINIDANEMIMKLASE